MPEQKMLLAKNDYIELDNYLSKIKAKRILLICGKSIEQLKIGKYFKSLTNRTKMEVIRFSDFRPNPQYESVIEGLKILHKNNCDTIIAVGGGSAIDVAKCIKLYSNMDDKINCLAQKIVTNDLPFIAIPTTAGTGSEATRFAVIYYNGEKQSISDYRCIPNAVLMDSSTLKTLPDYYRKSTMFDALCHAIESFWSINSTKESRIYSAKSIQMIMENKDAYLMNKEAGNTKMLEASNIAGKAINITQTTAGHAMCYQLTSLYGIAHGHAVSLCIAKLWPFMLDNLDKCIDPRGQKHMENILVEIAKAMGCDDKRESIITYQKLLDELNLSRPIVTDESDYEILKTSVNLIRLKNHPIQLDERSIDLLYHQILSD